MSKLQKVVVIGGSSGIGLAVAHAALAAKKEVIIAGRSVEKLQQAKQHLNHPNLQTKPVNTLEHQQLESFFKEVGPFHHLQIPASELVFKPLLALTEEEAHASLESKFWGTFRAVRAALPYLQKGGSITLFSGSASKRPLPGLELLSAINGAMEGFGRALAVSLNGTIRVNTIAPGLTQTPVLKDFSEESLTNIYEHNLIQRMAEPEEIAQTAIYLMENAYVTGQTLFVDGGFTLG